MNTGASLSLYYCTTVTGKISFTMNSLLGIHLIFFLNQAHNTSISIAVCLWAGTRDHFLTQYFQVKFHSEFYSHPLTRLLKTYLYVEMALGGTSEEKEQTASWPRWMHRHIHGSITEEMREEPGIPVDVETYDDIDELKVYVMYTLTWATIYLFSDAFWQTVNITPEFQC